jgi:hypothetical protein
MVILRDAEEKRQSARGHDRPADRHRPLFVRVHPDPAYGWHARVVTAPGEEICSQQSVDEAVVEIRTRFDLKE